MVGLLGGRRLKEQAEQIAALTALVAEPREQLDAARRAASRNSGRAPNR